MHLLSVTMRQSRREQWVSPRKAQQWRSCSLHLPPSRLPPPPPPLSPGPRDALGTSICGNWYLWKLLTCRLLVTSACFPFSLLEEDSEEEGDSCRICQIAGGSPTNPLLEPCGCVGSLRFVHQECLKKWLKVKITSGRWGRRKDIRAAICN